MRKNIYIDQVHGGGHEQSWSFVYFYTRSSAPRARMPARRNAVQEYVLHSSLSLRLSYSAAGIPCRWWQYSAAPGFARGAALITASDIVDDAGRICGASRESVGRRRPPCERDVRVRPAAPRPMVHGWPPAIRSPLPTSLSPPPPPVEISPLMTKSNVDRSGLTRNAKVEILHTVGLHVPDSSADALCTCSPERWHGHAAPLRTAIVWQYGLNETSRVER
jgi:hypothetical protein